jgi:putative oligomerization/nucleic acid binding protein/phospholipase D-like protein
MPLATFTFGDALLTLLEFAFLVIWIWIAVGVVFDIFRSHDLSNWGKALWMLFILVLPFVGILGYLIVRGHTMHEHQAADAQTRQTVFRQYLQGMSSGGTADDLHKLADLKERGILTDDEFARAKAKVLA